VSLQEDQDHTESTSVARTISKYLVARSKTYRELTEARQEVSRPDDTISRFSLLGRAKNRLQGWKNSEGDKYFQNQRKGQQESRRTMT